MLSGQSSTGRGVGKIREGQGRAGADRALGYQQDQAAARHRQAWTTRQAVYQATFEYIEGRYNTRRRHSSLGYQSPVAYEVGTRLTRYPLRPE